MKNLSSKKLGDALNSKLDKNDVLLHGAGDKTDYCQPMLCCECWWRARLRRGGTRTGFMMMVSWKIMKIGCWPWLGRIGGATIIYSFQKLSFWMVNYLYNVHFTFLMAFQKEGGDCFSFQLKGRDFWDILLLPYSRAATHNFVGGYYSAFCIN